MKKVIIPIVFALAGTSFVTYSFLDTFVIAKEYNISIDGGESTFSFSFAEMDDSSEPDSSSSSSSSTSINNSSANNSSINSSQNQSSTQTSSNTTDPYLVDGKYYEDMTKEQISALFTKDVVFEAKKHYSDPDIYIDITTDRFEDYSTYYAADIRLRSTKYLKIALAHDKAGENITEKTSEMCLRHKGILAINGDTYGSQNGGYVIRNGQIIRRTRKTGRGKKEDLAIYADGTFEIFSEENYTIDQIAAKGAWQVFSFGPGLIQDGVKIIQKGEEVGTASAGHYMNQRCAIGMIAPLHYIFVVSDGRIKSSPGLSLYQIGKIMEARHAYCAYNLDGGGSATMYMDDGTGNANGMGALVNYCTQQLVGNNNVNTLPENPPIGEREVSDIVYIGKE